MPTATVFASDDTRTPYRLCVGIVLFNRTGQVFLGERRKEPGAWQMPQGGIKEGQTPEQAVMAELREETGITSARIVAAHPAPLDYDFPDYLQGAFGGKYRGQRQYWFVVAFLGEDTEIQLVNPHETEKPEFKAWRWATLDEAVRLIVPFKRPVYEQVAAWAHPLLP